MGNSLNHKMEKESKEIKMGAWTDTQIERDKEAGRWIDRQTEGWMDAWTE